jgi:DNA-binding transcriptional LysR family regulator
MLQVRRLQLLRDVARLGSIAAAADAAGYSPSAVSQQLAMLERESGLPLLERSARSVRLTEPGRVLAEQAAPALAALRDAEAAARAAAGLTGGRLRVGTFPSAGARLVPAALATLAGRHPALALELHDLEPEDAPAALLDDRIDAAVTHEHELLPVREPPGIRRVEILREPHVLVVSRDHSSAGRARMRLSDLADERWIADRDSTGRNAITEAACARAGFTPEIAFRTADAPTAVGLVRAGLGIALLPRLAAEAAPGDGLAHITVTPPVRRVVWLSSRATTTHPGVAALRDALNAHA